MTHDFDQAFAFADGDQAHALVRRACHRLIRDCCGVTRATPADDRRGIDYWVATPRRRIGLDLKLRRKDYGARNGGPMDCVIELESHGTSGWLMKTGGAELILFATADTHRVAMFNATQLRTTVLINLSKWVQSGLAKLITTESMRGGTRWTSKAVVIPADVIESAIDGLDDRGAANDEGRS